MLIYACTYVYIRIQQDPGRLMRKNQVATPILQISSFSKEKERIDSSIKATIQQSTMKVIASCPAA